MPTTPKGLQARPHILGMLPLWATKPNILGMLSIGQIGQTVAAARSSAGLRQTDLAAKAGLSRATIDSLENGRATLCHSRQVTPAGATAGTCRSAPGRWHRSVRTAGDVVGACEVTVELVAGEVVVEGWLDPPPGPDAKPWPELPPTTNHAPRTTTITRKPAASRNGGLVHHGDWPSLLSPVAMAGG